MICARRACLSRGFRSAIRFTGGIVSIDRSHSAAGKMGGLKDYLRMFLHHAQMSRIIYSIASFSRM
jgi:hypothetical protein